MSSAPLPTRLVFLSNLPSLPHGEKVRFLGCVTSYDISTGTVALQHAYPRDQTGAPTTAVVNVDLLSETMKRTDTQVGEWVNVMGYVQVEEEGGRGVRKKKGEQDGQGKRVKVQAVVLWSAGGVKLAEYEKAVEMRKSAEAGC